MGKLNWPMLSRDRPKDVVEHADALKDDFKALHDYVKKLKASKRHLAKLPSGYKSKISKGIILGVTEAIENEYYPKFISDIDQDLFCKTLFQTIRSELITEVHDRIPLLEFDTLHNSYKELVKKLPSYLALDLRNRDMTPDSELEQSRGNGSRPPTSHIINQAAMPDSNPEDGEMEMEIDEDAHDILRTLQTIEDQGTLLGRQLEFLDGYTEDLGVPEIALGPGGNAMDDSEEGIDGVQAEDQEDATERKKLGEIRDSAAVKYGACKANAVERYTYLQDDNAGPTAIRGFDTEEGTMKTEENCGHTRKEETPNIQDVAAGVQSGLSTAAFSKPVTFEIKQQVSVNRLVLATSQEILDQLYRSLQKIITTRESVTDWIHLSEPRLADDGRLMFRADTDSQDLFRASIDAWAVEFEAGISPRVPTFKIALPNLGINSMNIETRKRKADVIHELIDLNDPRLSSIHCYSDIVDLVWKSSKRKRSTWLLIEFSNRQLAKQVLQQGLEWQGIIYRCQMIPLTFWNPRCSRCQAYGHEDAVCSAPYCCGRCAEAHPTTDCTSPNTRCALCGGPHRAKHAKCPVRIAEQKKIRFATPEPIAHNGKREPVTVRSDVEMAGTMGGPNLPPSTSALAASPKNTDIDDEQLRLTRCGKCQGYGHVAGKCSARLRCGKCALHHFTWKCRSTFARCAVCNGDHIASSAVCPARPQDKARSQQLRKSERQEPEIKIEPRSPSVGAAARPSILDLSMQEPEIKSEPQSPSPGVAVAARPKRTPKKRSMLAQVKELIQIVSKGNSREMAFIKDHLEALGSAMMAEGGDIVATTPRAGKRRAQEVLMSGALQDLSGSPKRMRF